jgi:hypothetical protein
MHIGQDATAIPSSDSQLPAEVHISIPMQCCIIGIVCQSILMLTMSTGLHQFECVNGGLVNAATQPR